MLYLTSDLPTYCPSCAYEFTYAGSNRQEALDGVAQSCPRCSVDFAIVSQHLLLDAADHAKSDLGRSHRTAAPVERLSPSFDAWFRDTLAEEEGATPRRSSLRIPDRTEENR